MKWNPMTWFAAAPPMPVTSGRGLRAATENSADIPENGRYWRRLGEQSRRELPQVEHAEMVKECAHAAQTDGMARAHVRLVTSITVGAQEIGPQVECPDEKSRMALQEKVDLVWNDPMNDLGCALEDFMAGLTTTGSLCLVARTGEGSRITRFGYIDPAGFAPPGVLTDPDNARESIAVLRTAPGVAGRVIAHPVIRADFNVPESFRGVAEGSPVKLATSETQMIDAVTGSPCFYLGINRIAPNHAVGISDLYPALDTMRATSDLVFNAIERSLNLGAYSIHVKFPKGTPQADIDKRMDTIRRDIESGSGRAVGSTDDVSIEAVAAALQAGEWATLERTGRTAALIALGPWPVHLFSEGAGTNVTAAAEQGSPVANFLLSRQNAFRRLILRAVEYAVRQFPEARAILESRDDVKFVLPLPTIVAKNTTRESNVLAVEIATLRQMEADGYLKHEVAQREAIDAAARYGFSVTPSDIPTPEEEAKRREESGFAPQGFDLMPEPGETVNPEADPRGGHREGEKGKIPEGTPSKNGTKAPANRVAVAFRNGEPTMPPSPQMDPSGKAPPPGATQEVMDMSFNDLSLSLGRARALGDTELVDAIREEMFRRLGKEKPDKIEVEAPTTAAPTDKAAAEA